MRSVRIHLLVAGGGAGAEAVVVAAGAPAVAGTGDGEKAVSEQCQGKFIGQRQHSSAFF